MFRQAERVRLEFNSPAWSLCAVNSLGRFFILPSASGRTGCSDKMPEKSKSLRIPEGRGVHTSEGDRSIHGVLKARQSV